MTLTLGITWARGTGSTLPGKNKYPVLGKPLIHYPLAALKKSGTVDHHYVFTEDDEIAEEVIACGWKVIPRPRHLIHYNDNKFSMQDAWRLIVEHVQKDLQLALPQFNGNWGTAFRLLSDYSFNLNCNNCMLRSRTFNEMFKILKNEERPMVYPAVRSHDQLMIEHSDGYLFPLWSGGDLNRQYYPRVYKPLLNTFFQNPRNTVTARPMRYFYEIEEIEAMDVHSMYEIEFMESFLENHSDYFEENDSPDSCC